MMASWRQQPKKPVTVHSDQGSQFTGNSWQEVLCDHSMSRRGNCHENAVAESFFQLIKRGFLLRKTY